MYLTETITNRNGVMTVVKTKKFMKLMLLIYNSIIKYGIFFKLIHLKVDTSSDKEIFTLIEGAKPINSFNYQS